MTSWISDLLLFAAGVAGGLLVAEIKLYLTTAKRQRTQLVAARTRVLAGIKEKHEEEILDEAFRTTEAIKGELDKSLQSLQRTLNAVTMPEAAEPDAQNKPVIQLSNVIKSSQSAS